MAHHKTGSVSRQERRRQAKVGSRLQGRRARQAWKSVKAGRTTKKIRPMPQAGSSIWSASFGTTWG
jgi:hypothetical protein